MIFGSYAGSTFINVDPVKKGMLMIYIKKIKSEADKKFVKHCLETDDFKKYIGELSEYNSDTALFCTENGEYLGVLFPNITDTFGIRISIPAIYLLKKYERKNAWCISNSIEYIFQKYKADKMQFIIYGHYFRSHNILIYFGIFIEGKFEKAILIDGKREDIFYYSILKEEYQELRRRFNDKYYKN